MLRKIRIVLAALFFMAVTLLFLDFTGAVHGWLGWTAKMQFLPALLSLNLGVVAFLVLLTLVFGRVYCSVICPLGVMQDIISWLGGRKRSFRFSWSPEKKWLRYGVLVLFIALLLGGAVSAASLIAPYSAYGRIAQNLFSPLYACGNNILAYFAERADSYAFYSTEVWIRSLSAFAVAAATFILIAILAWRGGRTYCNTVCPVGTVLGLLSRFSLFRPVIDAEKCRNCSLCAKKCKASGIDYRKHEIDYSRCVACMDCIDVCRHDAIHYRSRFGKKAEQDSSKGPDMSRRSFLTASVMAAGASVAKAQEKKVDGGLAVIEDKKIPVRTTHITPPGSGSIRHLAQHCTACQLCVSVCPNGVLRPSTDLIRLMQPEMGYERGYCRPECTKCSEVCPTGAISPVTVEEKSSLQIGHAVWVKENCLPLTDGVSCGNCARHCPAGAISMVLSDTDNPESVKIPVVDAERCIGCGACEALCPARPFSAIYVEGHEVHRTI